jgi:transcription initiation factor TFIIH subunit 3
MPALYSNLLHNLDEFVAKDQQLTTTHKPGTVPSSLLSGALSMALCCILFTAPFYAIHFTHAINWI